MHAHTNLYTRTPFIYTIYLATSPGPYPGSCVALTHPVALTLPVPLCRTAATSYLLAAWTFVAHTQTLRASPPDHRERGRVLAMLLLAVAHMHLLRLLLQLIFHRPLHQSSALLLFLTSSVMLTID